jgi:SAM-dependent methyltransferase
MINPEEIANIERTEASLWWFRGMREIGFRLLDRVFARTRIERAFEGGCGVGLFAEQVSRRYGIRLTAGDLDAAAIRLARGRGLAAVRADIAALPFPDGCFDLAMAMDVLAHFAPGEERRPMAELSRILRPGGRLLARTSALGVFRSRHSEFVWERQRFDRPRLRAATREAGLEVETLAYANFLLSPAALLKFRVWEPLTRQAPATGLEPLPAPLEAVFYVALRLEAAAIGRGVQFPFGQSLYLVARKPEKVS